MSKSGPQFYNCYNNAGMRPQHKIDQEKEALGDDFRYTVRNRRDKRNAGQKGMFLYPRIPKLNRRPRPAFVPRQFTHPRHLRAKPE